MKHLLLPIVFLLLSVWVFYDIKSSIKTREASFPNGTIKKKELPRVFKLAIMFKMFVDCLILLVLASLILEKYFGFDLLRMLW